ncbi:MAG: ribosomal RNA small subunit methyltransferase A [Candidatus Cloacimonadota bacterium]|nr:MAG: ribosomal RNA small subunit methyltransferase A [Candidatus Cloacimonadota bacterium]
MEFIHKKKYGQNFLKDPNICRKIIKAANLSEDEKVWEVGPGKGILTQELLKCVSDLTCFEIDPELYPFLDEKFGNKIKLIKQDVLKSDWNEIAGKNKIKIVANLPYQITSPFLFKAAEFSERTECIVVMIQKEVAARIKARSGTKDYGLLSLKMHYFFDAEYLFTVPPHLFIPPPKVNSAVIKFSPRKNKPVIEREEFFWKIATSAFRNRRKMLRNNLRSILAKEEIEKLAETGKIELTRRGESLGEEEFIRLYSDICHIVSLRRS